MVDSAGRAPSHESGSSAGAWKIPRGPLAAARVNDLESNPAAFYVDYGDFRCLRLRVTDVRYVGGFGLMSWVDAQAYAAAQPDPADVGGGGHHQPHER
jgi:hypothetical protein